MSPPLGLAIAQVNPTVGDFSGNALIIESCIERAQKLGAGLVIFPELGVSGYPPEDLLIRPSFLQRSEETINEIASKVSGITVLLGAPIETGGARNAAVILEDGKWRGSVLKKELPNYSVFDERRYFTPGDNGPLVCMGDYLIGVTVCEDIWVENDIVERQVKDGANVLVNISGSPYRADAFEERKEIVTRLAKRFNVPFAYVNIVGGQDELVFDGRSFVSDSKGNITAQCEAFIEDLLMVEIKAKPSTPSKNREVIEVKNSPDAKPVISGANRRYIEDENEEIYEAITLGTRDYVNKNGFKEVVIALSGGIDSALTFAIAADALGLHRVHVVTMPSPFSSSGSTQDADKMAKNLGLECISLPIENLIEEYDGTLAKVFEGKEKDVTEENIQARIRGDLVMALSNKFGWLVLATGNKSELATGYCTLYGDMAGGFAVIKDVFKTKVYELCRWRNKKAGYDLIPNEIIEKEPSAELRPDQKDTDSLPPYDVLDPILREYIENDKNVDEIERLGYSRPLVLRIVGMVDRNEYKRRQGPIGVKITVKAFGRDRRLPVTNKFLDE